MNVQYWLKKLGILRYGAEAAVYTNAKDRPLSFQDSGVFDSDRDVWNRDKKPSLAPPVETPPVNAGQR